MALRLALLLLLALIIGLHNAASAQRSDAMGMAEPAVAAMAPPHVGLRAKSMSVSRDQAMPMPGMADAFGAAEVGGMDGGGGGARGMNSGVDLPADVTRRRLIETANGEIEVESVRQALERAQTIATQAGGVVVSANERNLSEGGKYGSADIVVRVPVEKFRATWASLLQIAKKVMHSSTAAEDITEQYVDTAVRLKNLEATHAQFLKLLQRATSVQETLEVQRELSRVAGDLEALKGRLTYLDRSASMGTIHLSLHNWARPEERPQAGWSPLVTLKKALSSLVSLSMSMVDGLIYIAVFGGPLVVVCALVGVAYNARTHAA